MPRLAWLVLGTALLLGGFWPFAVKIYAGAAARAASGGGAQLPLGTLCGAAWDVEEEVALVALCEFARVQAYDGDGQFRFGWSVPTSGGKFHFSRLTEGRYEAEIVRGRRRIVLNARGKESAMPDAPRFPKSTPEQSTIRAKPRLVVAESPMGDTISVEWPGRTVRLGGSWTAPLLVNKLLSFALGVLGVVCLETWRRRR